MPRLAAIVADTLDSYPEYRKLLGDDGCPAAREVEVARISDPRALAWIAVSDPDLAVALRAVEAVADPSLCIAIATKAPSGRVRRAAVGKIWDVGVLRAISVSDVDPLVRVYALEALGDPAFAAERARRDPAAFVRLNAVQGVDDRHVLMAIANEDDDECVRSSAGYRAWLLNPSTLDLAFPAPGM